MSRRLIAAAAAVLALGAAGGAGIVLATGGGGSEPEALDLHPVAGSFEPDGTKLTGCEADRRCLEQAFGNLAYGEGPKAALREFEQRMARDPAVEAGCHRIVHTIGSAALARYRGDVARAFAEGSSACWSGYYHGILERAFAGVKTKGGLTEAAREVCSSPSLRRDLWLTYQCVHGLGHGLMIQSGYNLPFSLDACDRLASSWDQTSCTGGVFMENIATGPASAYGVRSPWLEDDDLVYPCNAPVAKGRELYCYLMVTSRVLQANDYDWRATAQVCAGVDEAWVATCFQSFGRDADGFTRQDPVEVRRLCRLAGAHERECIYGAARDMTANYSGGERASALCRGVATGLRAYCFEGIGTILGTIGPDGARRRALCSAAARGVDLRACLRGAGVG